MHDLQLYEQHHALGAAFDEGKIWRVPLHYGDVLGEHAAVRHSAGILDLSDTGKLNLQGADATGILQGILTNDVKKLSSGEGLHSFILNDIGRIQSYLNVYRVESGFLIETPVDLDSKTQALIDYYIITEDAQTSDITETWGLLSVQGPQATAALSDSLQLPTVGERRHVEATLNSIPVRVVRRSRTGETGFDLWMESQHLAAAWRTLLECGKKVGARAVGRAALEILRVEAGIPLYGTDMTDANNPLEVGLTDAISFDKGCYLGQEVIARITNLSKPVRRLVGVLTEPAAPLLAGDRLMSEDREVGRITSAITSPSLKRPIAIGYVRTDSLSRAANLRAVTANGDIDAMAQELPLFRSGQPAPAPPNDTSVTSRLPF